MKFTLSSSRPSSQFLNVRMDFDTVEGNMVLNMPIWRPGRYLPQDYAKNVQDFQAYVDGKRCEWRRTGLNQWTLKGVKTGSQARVEYRVLANELDAGTTYVSQELFYVNPITCLMSLDGYEGEVLMEVAPPKLYGGIVPLPNRSEGLYVAEDMHQLYDSPLLFSTQMSHEVFSVRGVEFNVWVHSKNEVPWAKLELDFVPFIAKQIQDFEEFPAEEFHFLVILQQGVAYHGVEHLKSTVITLGPEKDVFDLPLYKELLGVSSHELYHCWNVKSIRPSEWVPYNYFEQSPSCMGYLAEGVTTYMGDLYLMLSGIFSPEDYLEELQKQYNAYMRKSARFRSSVAADSYTTWIDGYGPMKSGQRLSIYGEGALLAFMTDVQLLLDTERKNGLRDVMRSLYESHGSKGVGVTEDDYFSRLAEFGLQEVDRIRDEYFYGTRGYEAWFPHCAEALGIELKVDVESDHVESKLGIRYTKGPGGLLVQDLYPGSAAEMGGVRYGDLITKVNDRSASEELGDLSETEVVLGLSRLGEDMALHLPNTNKNFFCKHELSWTQKKSLPQRQVFNKWSS